MKAKAGSKMSGAMDSKYSILEKVALTAGSLLLVVFTIIGMEFTLHGSHLSRLQGVGRAAPAVGDALFSRTMEMFTGTHMTDGNHVTVLLNGEQTYPAIWKELRGAKQTITMQMYYFEPGKIADTLSVILRERAKSGVSVHLLTDAFGAQKITSGYIDTLAAAGVQAIIATGGTGITSRDSTYEVVTALLQKRLDGFGELIREDAQRMLVTAKAWSSATRQARVALEFGARSDQLDRVGALLREASPALRRALWEELSPALQARFRPSSAVERPSPAMKSLAARLVHETTR